MSEFLPGGADEVVRILWIADFRNEAQGLFGHLRRATEEFKKAAAEQRKTNAVTMKTAKQAADAAKAAQQAQREELREFQRLLQRRKTLENERLDAAKRVAAEEEKLARKSVTNRKAIEKLERQTARAISREEKEDLEKRAPILRKKLREEAKIWDEFEKDVIKINFIAQRDRINLADVYDGKMLQHQRNLRTKQAAEERKARKDQRKEDLAEVASRYKPDLDALDAYLKGRLDMIDDAHKIELAKQQDANRALLDAINERIAIRRDELKETETVIDRLTELEERHGRVIGDILTRHRGRQRDLGVELGLLEANKDAIEADHSLRRLTDGMRAMREEAKQTGRVSANTWADFEQKTRDAKLSQQAFDDEMKKAGMSVKNFADEKTRELRILRSNTRQLGDHNTVMRSARRAWGHVAEQMRLSTNEMILFARLMRLLLIPVFAAFIGVAIAGITDLIGGFVALVAALAPIAGEIAALPPIVLSVVQAMAVWKIATDNLGKSANDLGKVIQTSLTGSTEDFQKLVKQLPPVVAEFANLIRRDLMPGFRLLRAELQVHIFTALTEGLRRIIPAFRPLRAEVVGTAQVIGDAIDAFSRGVSTPRVVRDLREQMEVTNRFLEGMIPVIGRVASGLLDISRAADPLISHLLEMADQFSRWFERLGRAGRASGSLRNFFEATNESLDRTLSIIGHFSMALINIGKIAYRVIGRQLLIDLQRVTKQFEAWTSSPRGVRAITKYFKDLKPVLYEAGRLLRDLVKEMFRFSGDPAMLNILRQLRTEALPALSDAFRTAMQVLAPAIIDFLVAFAETLAAISKEGGGIIRVLQIFTKFFEFLSRFVGTGVGKLAFEALAFIAIFRSARFLSAVTGFRIFSRILVGIVALLFRGVVGANAFNRALASAPLIGGVVRRAVPSVITQPGVARAPGATATFFGLGGSAGGIRGVREQRAAARAAVALPGMAGTIDPVTGTLIPVPAGARGPSNFGRVIRSAGFAQASGAASLAAAVGGGFIGGRTGAILQGAGSGALIGSMFGPWGTAIGAAVGGLGAFVLTLNRTNKSLENFKKAADRFTTVRARAAVARQQLPEAVLGVRRARFDFQQARTQRRFLESIVGADPTQLRQARLAEDEARLRLNQALKFLRQTKEAIAQGIKVTEQTVGITMGRIRGILDDPSLKLVERRFGGGAAADIAAKRIRKLADNFDNPKLKAGIMRAADFVDSWNSLDVSKTLTLNLNRIIRTFVQPGAAPGAVAAGFGNIPFGPGLDASGQNIPGITGVGLVQGAQSGRGQAEEGRAARAAAERARADRLVGIAADRLEAAMDAAATAADRFSVEADRLANVAQNLQAVFQQNLDMQRARFESGLERRGIDPGGFLGVQRTATFDIGVLRRTIKFNRQIAKIFEQQIDALLGRLASLRTARADPTEIAAVEQQIRELRQSIGQLAVDELTSMTEIIRNRRLRRQAKLDSLIERLSIQSERKDIKLRQIEIQQQIAGTFDTPGGAAARSSFITNKIIPSLQNQLKAMERALEAVDPKTGRKIITGAKRQELQTALMQKQLEILEAQLSAQEAIKDNTGDIERNTGNLSFEFQGQRFTDSFALGVGV